MPGLAGRVFKVKDELALIPVLLGDIPPLLGFAGWGGITVSTTYWVQFPPFEVTLPIFSGSATTTANGSFSIPSDISSPWEGYEVLVTLVVSSGVPLYRSAFVPLEQVSTGQLNFWLFPYPLPSSDGITAGTISSDLSSSLPAGTTLTTSAAGLDLAGINETAISLFPDQIHVDFGVAVTPDSGPDLADFVDVSIRYADINIDFPTSVVVSNNQVLQAIQSAIAGAAGTLNATVLTKMEGIIESQLSVSAAEAQKFFTQEVSVTFSNVIFSDHSWGIGDTSDNTVVMTANPCIGFPRTPTPGEPIL